MILSTTAKSAYVSGMRGIRFLARKTGIVDTLSAKLPDRRAHWWLSLLAIHDIDAMVALDVPWWTYDSIDRIEDFLKERPRANVFEYGSGASTAWLAHRAAHVVSVEHDAGWYEIVSDRVRQLGNVDLKFVPADAEFDTDYGSTKAGFEGSSFKSYAGVINLAKGPFDLIVVDGRARVACVKEAFKHLADDGLIVFDNSNRKEYRSAIYALDAEVIEYPGRVPSLPYKDQTTLIRARASAG